MSRGGQLAEIEKSRGGQLAEIEMSRGGQLKLQISNFHVTQYLFSLNPVNNKHIYTSKLHPSFIQVDAALIFYARPDFKSHSKHNQAKSAVLTYPSILILRFMKSGMPSHPKTTFLSHCR